jgi:hypothetical protein
MTWQGEPMHRSIYTLLGAVLLLCFSASAHAADLTGTDAQVSNKKVTLSFNLSETLDVEKIYDYSSNLVKIKVPGLKFTATQLKGDKLLVQDEHGEQFYRYTRFSAIEGGGMITIYLGKICSPADALVVPREKKIEVEIIKPTWKLDAAGSSQPPADTTAPADINPPADTTPPADTMPPADTTPPADTDPLDAEVQPASNQNPGDGGVTTSPAFDNSAAHSYRKFDLSQVPASKVEIKGVPFDEAILMIVAGSGFNVAVGSGIDDTEVNLNFTQKGISLESALDILCMAYELKYTVDDDAIVISRR